jgi:hypothetical protein
MSILPAAMIPVLCLAETTATGLQDEYQYT